MALPYDGCVCLHLCTHGWSVLLHNFESNLFKPNVTAYICQIIKAAVKLWQCGKLEGMQTFAHLDPCRFSYIDWWLSVTELPGCLIKSWGQKQGSCLNLTLFLSCPPEETHSDNYSHPPFFKPQLWEAPFSPAEILDNGGISESLGYRGRRNLPLMGFDLWLWVFIMIY